MIPLSFCIKHRIHLQQKESVTAAPLLCQVQCPAEKLEGKKTLLVLPCWRKKSSSYWLDTLGKQVCHGTYLRNTHLGYFPPFSLTLWNARNVKGYLPRELLAKKIQFNSCFICYFSIGSNNVVFNPHNLAKNLTPTLLKTRERFETMSAGSTTDTEGAISPMWECDEVSDC